MEPSVDVDSDPLLCPFENVGVEVFIEAFTFVAPPRVGSANSVEFGSWTPVESTCSEG